MKVITLQRMPSLRKRQTKESSDHKVDPAAWQAIDWLAVIKGPDMARMGAGDAVGSLQEERKYECHLSGRRRWRVF